MLYDFELEIFLRNMTENSEFFETDYDRERGRMWNGYPIKISSGTEVEISGKKFNFVSTYSKSFN